MLIHPPIATEFKPFMVRTPLRTLINRIIYLERHGFQSVWIDVEINVKLLALPWQFLSYFALLHICVKPYQASNLLCHYHTYRIYLFFSLNITEIYSCYSNLLIGGVCPKTEMQLALKPYQASFGWKLNILTRLQLDVESLSWTAGPGHHIL